MLGGGGVQVGTVTVIAPGKLRPLAMMLAEQAERSVAWPGLGRRPPPPFTLVVVEGSLALGRMSRGRAPGWGAGVAFPQARAVILRADLPDLERTLRHELGHLVLRDTVHARVPLWFEEGYASLAAAEFDRSDALALNLAVVAGRIPSLRELDAMLRGSATSADLAYALAASAVQDLARRPAPGGLGPLLGRLGDGADFGTALLVSTGLSEDRLEGSCARCAVLKVKYYSLPNVLAGRELVPEISQNELTPDSLAQALERWLDDPPTVASFEQECDEIHRRLRCDASQRAADAVLEWLP